MTINSNIKEAKKILKHYIKFFESLKDHIVSGKEPMLSRAMFATWCLHRIINDQLIHDIEEAMKSGNKTSD